MYLKFTIFLLLIFSGSFSCWCQESSPAMKGEPDPIHPILIDKRAMSGLDLKPVKNSTDPDRRLFQKRLFYGKEISVYIVSSETATANWTNYGIEEFIYVINGRARLNPEHADQQFFNVGDMFMAPRGYAGEWETQGGTEFYHELSVISTNRPKTNSDSTRLPILLDKAKIAGIGLSRVADADEIECYHDVLSEGYELDVHLYAEAGIEKIVESTEDESLNYVIAGSVTITSTSGKAETYLAGDFFILPLGFSGNWKSEGHHLFRWLSVVKSK